MFKRHKKIPYGENKVAKWIRLAYKPNGTQFNAIFVLPQNPGKLAETIPFVFGPDSAMDFPTSETELATLSIPRFKIEYGAELKALLQAIGIKAAFSHKSGDFKAISENQDLIISKVLHKAMVEVDEVGTVAAAATAVVMMKRKGVMNAKIYSFKCDQPFFFMIEHVPSKSIIFTAKINDPTTN